MPAGALADPTRRGGCRWTSWSWNVSETYLLGTEIWFVSLLHPSWLCCISLYFLIWCGENLDRTLVVLYFSCFIKIRWNDFDESDPKYASDLSNTCCPITKDIIVAKYHCTGNTSWYVTPNLSIGIPTYVRYRTGLLHCRNLCLSVKALYLWWSPCSTAATQFTSVSLLCTAPLRGPTTIN
jgi:hypothetical protein